MEFLVALLVLGLPVVVVGGIVLAVVKPEVRDRLRAGWATVSRSLAGRLVLVLVTGIVLLIPLQMVDELRRDRGYRLDAVQQELFQQWGTTQNVVGPVVWVPVLDRWEEQVERRDNQNRRTLETVSKEIQRNFVILPEDLDVRGILDTDTLHRGLYDVLVYEAEVQLQATFRRPELTAREGHTLVPLWDEARLVVELTDLTAVAAVDELVWQDQTLRPDSGSIDGQSHHTGIRGNLPGFEGEVANASMTLKLRGMRSLGAAALGEQSSIAMNGDWGSPSFYGFTLPADRTVQTRAFDGTWSIPGVGRPMPQLIELNSGVSLDPLRLHTVGVALVEPASPYASVERAITYGMLVIALCLLTFLVLEHGMRLELHPVQWLVNGLALVVFYLILLATSEHSGFDVAYGSASAVTVGLISAYTVMATRAPRAGMVVFGSLSVLYGAMYGMLRSEDHSLLMGTSLVVAALVGVMWVTRGLASREPDDDAVVNEAEAPEPMA
ncbi:MAG: cell envelope integrity protein CreD [Myxococcota bacterium]